MRNFPSSVDVPSRLKDNSGHMRPNRELWGLRSFSTEAIYAAAAVSNCNIKTAALFFELKNIEIYIN